MQIDYHIKHGFETNEIKQDITYISFACEFYHIFHVCERSSAQML